ncbi:MAG: ABC transporter permease [Cyclobacteriaceae bacterium]
MFNLEGAIKDWLRQFRKHKAFNHGSVREMELHLRDHIEDLIASGHSQQKAFDLAVDEFGEIPSMAREEFQNIKTKRTFLSIIDITMLSNYLRIGIRNFTKQPFFTTLNTFGLAIGMAGGLLIALFIYDELSFDRMFSDADRIYRINIDNQTSGEYSQYASAPGPMADVLHQDCPQVELVTRFREVGSTLMRKPDATLNVKEAYVTGADSAFFEMFGIELLDGNKNTALKQPKSLVLTESVAKKHFGDEKALGKSLLLDDTEEYVVTGVMADLPKNSFLRNHGVYISLSSYKDEHTPAWNTWYFPTFVKLKPYTNAEDLQAFLDTVKERYLIPWAMTFVPGLTIESSRAADKESGNFMKFNTTALTDIHLYSSNREGEFSANSDMQNVYIMSFIGFFLLLLASVNFMNLSTAQSLKRAKEVGIRKTLGSNRLGVIRQFLTESFLISFLSLWLAILIALIVMPFFNELSGKSIAIPFEQPIFWLLLILATFFLGLFSGSYPAFFMSRFIPAHVLKGSLSNVGGGKIRNSLVVFQFAIAVFLIVSTLVVFQQVNFIRNKDLGFQKDQILVIDDIYAAGNQLESYREKVKQLAQVESVSLSSYLPTPSSRGGTTYFSEGAIEDETFKSEKAMIIEEWDIDYDYITTLGLEVVAGRGFDKKFGTDSAGIILNESAVVMMETTPEKVLGTRLTKDIHREDKENTEYFTVIGVVRNFHFETLRNRIAGLTMVLGGKPNKMMVKLSGGDFHSTISSLEKTWKEVAPGQPFNYYFMDESFNETYRAEQRLGSIFTIFTMLSIFIACIGLFGLAAFNAEKRTKEIGIKKVLGASVRTITYQLSIDFLKLVMVAIIVALPLSWYAMNQWLQDFSYRIEISWLTMVIAALLAIVISIVTVSYQSIKAAIVNPVNSLRSE